MALPPCDDCSKPAPSPWLAALAAVTDLREPGEAGAGDTVERLLGAGGLAAKALVRVLVGHCHCEFRRQEWNARFPYR